MFSRTQFPSVETALSDYPVVALLGARQVEMAIEVKKGSTAKPRRGFYSACEDLQPAHKFLVNGADGEAYPVGEGVLAVGLRGLVDRLS